tara:strand:+ start:768 stop:950 length:183 start_codon:yes stop_codon:yes gene_type:complete
MRYVSKLYIINYNYIKLIFISLPKYITYIDIDVFDIYIDIDVFDINVEINIRNVPPKSQI